MKKILLLMAISFTFSSFAIEKDKRGKTEALDKTFKIKSDFYSSNEKMKNATLRITENGVTYKVIPTENGKIEFTLPRNSQFMLEFSSEGHFTKRIAINTELSSSINKVPMLMLTMVLIEKDIPYLLKEDLELFDFPLVYMAFNSTGKYYYDKNKYYSEIIINGLNEGVKRYFNETKFSFH